MSITVAVPPPQHSPTFGHCASAQTVWSFSRWSVSRTRWYRAPPGSWTRSQPGLAARMGSPCSRRPAATSRGLAGSSAAGAAPSMPSTGRLVFEGSLMLTPQRCIGTALPGQGAERRGAALRLHTMATERRMV